MLTRSHLTYKDDASVAIGTIGFRSGDGRTHLCMYDML